MQLIIITNCSASKTAPPEATLQARALKRGSVESLAETWLERWARIEPSTCAGRLYRGRAFLLVRQLANAVGADLRIVSAGLGVVKPNQKVPSYSLSVSRPTPDCILKRAYCHSPFSSSDWWRAIRPYRKAGGSFRRLMGADSALVVVAVTRPYLDMIAPELSGLEVSLLERLRIVGPKDSATLPANLQPCTMPYDMRLNDLRFGLSGTEFDFPARALSHFVELIRSDRKIDPASEHARRVRLSLSRCAWPLRLQRPTLNDSELRRQIAALKHVASSSAVALNHLRHALGFACEQKRFARAWAGSRKEMQRA